LGILRLWLEELQAVDLLCLLPLEFDLYLLLILQVTHIDLALQASSCNRMAIEAECNRTKRVLEVFNCLDLLLTLDVKELDPSIQSTRA
jgi:hypothetical protein